jgi:lipopolysaccharide transport system permease protein
MNNARPRELGWYGDILTVLIRKELAVRYKNSFLGYLWSLLNPLTTALIFYVVFGVYMRLGTQNYIVVLLSALFPWQWFTNSVGQSPYAFLSNITLVKKVAFPRQLIPLVTVLQDMVHFLIALPVYFCFMLAHGLYPGWQWLYGIPLLLALTLGLVYGLSLLVASVNLFFRDLGNLVGIFINLAFYGTPVMYTISHVPERYLPYFKLNPVAPLFICWRSMLMESSLDPVFLPYAFGYSVLCLALGLAAYTLLHKRFAEAM